MVNVKVIIYLIVDKLDIDKLEKLDVDKLSPVLADLSELSIIVKNDVVKKYVYDANIKDIKNKIPNITNLITNTALKAKINDVKGEIPDVSDFAKKQIMMQKYQTGKKTILHFSDYNKLYRLQQLIYLMQRKKKKVT